MKKVIAVCLVGIFASCAPTKIVAPLEHGQWQGGATLAQPQINDGSIPVIGLYAAKGITDQTTAYGGIGVMSTLFGAFQLEGGVVKGLQEPNGLVPGFSYSYGANSFLSTRDAALRLYPDAGANVYWQKGGHIAHVSANTWVDPTWFMTRYDKGQILAPSFGAGYRYRHKWFEAQLEYKLLNPTRELLVPQANVPGFQGLGGRGWYYGVAVNF